LIQKKVRALDKNIEIVLLRSFLAIAETSSFTIAASRINCTQAAISMQIKRLEEIAGGSLFERTSRQVTLNRRGELLRSHARRMVGLNDEALAQLYDDKFTGLVRVGAIEDFAVRVLPPVLSKFINGHPEIAIEVETGFTSDLLGRLGKDFDLVLAMHPVGSGKGEMIRRERAVWIGSRQFARHEQIVLPLALHPAGCQFRQAALTVLDNAKRLWRLTYISQSLGAIEGATAAGLAITVGKSGALPNGLEILGVADGLPELPIFEIALHRAPRCNSPGVSALAEFFKAELSLPDPVFIQQAMTMS
jgi:DNA-binding transcriptional LysR family regulator